MLDVVLLKVIKYRQDYNKLVYAIPLESLDPKTQALIKDFGKYFKKFETHDKIDMQVFLPRFKQWHPDMTDEQFNAYRGVLRNITKDVDEETKVGVLSDLYEVDLATKVANLCNQYNQGDLNYGIAESITASMDAYKINIGARDVKWDDTDINDLLGNENEDEGIRWRLNVLNNHMRNLQPGDFGIIAARPDKGKTTFLSSECTFMAPQLPEDKNVLWLNNEGMSGRIVKRLYQSAIGIPLSQMRLLSEQGELNQAYINAVGRRDKIRVVNVHGMHSGQVEAIIENSNPGIIIYDMIDNIRGFDSEARTDRQLEAMYQWARERSVKYECIGFGTSQISNDGDGLQFPTLGMLKDSKTGKQGACDFQLMIGAVNDANMLNSRFLGLPKNKLTREGKRQDPRAEVIFNNNIARYEDLPLDVLNDIKEEETVNA